jgi:hypothetical protein
MAAILFLQPHQGREDLIDLFRVPFSSFAMTAAILFLQVYQGRDEPDRPAGHPALLHVPLPRLGHHDRQVGPLHEYFALTLKNQR